MTDKIYGVSQIMKNIIHQFPIPSLLESPSFPNLLSQLSSFAVMCISSNHALQDESTLMAAADEFMCVWANLIEKLEFYQASIPAELAQVLAFLSGQIVNCYITMRMVPDTQEQDCEVEGESKDCETFKSQLIHIAILARLSAYQVLLYLRQHIDVKLDRLGVLFASRLQSKEITAIQEQLHWLILIIGHVLCDASEGEVPLIPNQLLQLRADTNGENLIVSISLRLIQILDILNFSTDSFEVPPF